MRAFHRPGKSTGRYISYLVKEGLANRLKSHLLASHIAKATGRTLVPVWRKTTECNAAYSDLFAQEQSEPWSFGSEFLVTLDQSANSSNWEFKRDGDRPEDLLVLDLPWQYIPMDRVIDYLGGPSAFSILAQNSLRPNVEIGARIAAKSAPWSDTMIGVQIRRGDFVKFDQALKLERYINATERALAACPDAGVFLASDGAAEELEPFLSQFSRRLNFQATVQRDRLEGVQDALVDLILLSKCDRLVITPLSSFGELAAKITNVECEWA